jgi:hypothetical protein
MERRWLTLARSCEFTQSLGDFADETKRRVTNLREPTSPKSALATNVYSFALRATQ